MKDEHQTYFLGRESEWFLGLVNAHLLIREENMFRNSISWLYINFPHISLCKFHFISCRYSWGANIFNILIWKSYFVRESTSWFFEYPYLCKRSNF